MTCVKFKPTVFVRRYISYLMIILTSWSQPLYAAVNFKRGTVLRDAESEKILKSYITPIFQKAGLDPAHLHCYLLCDSELNAFAASRYTIVLHSGLIQKAKNVDEIIGVLAHETGHIAGGHLARFEAVMKKASMINMAGVAVGLLAGMASNRPDLGGALMMGAMDSAIGNMLHYSRGQEAAADQAAIRFLNALHWPADGLVTFMETLNQQELLASMNQDPYFRTHPLSSDRIHFIKNSIKLNAKHYQFPKDFQNNFQILKAKLDGYLNPPGQTLLKYPEKDVTFASRYARAIAYYKNNQTKKSILLLQQLIREYPENPYILELLGQIYYENGRSYEAIQALRKAHYLVPTEPLIKIALSQALIEKFNSLHLQEALKLLREAVKIEDDNPLAWHLLALTYGKINNIGMAALSLAEEALCVNKFKLARQQAKRAEALLKDPQSRLRAQDIIGLAEEESKDNNDADDLTHSLNITRQ